MSTVAERVAAGVEWLNANYPDWREKVTLNDFNIQSTCNCVLGKLFTRPDEDNPSYAVDGFDYALDSGIVTRPAALGFDANYVSPLDVDFASRTEAEWAELQAEWERVLAEPVVVLH